ncbi:hypothetical protein [Clostridioides difficile]|uniref:hypothetical protein n=1 Tax=Clostridioides difficile TaxID=1496 RepID=UPI00374E29C4
MRFIQKLKSLIIKDSTIIQQQNVYKNEYLIEDYMKEIFEDIDRLIESRRYDEAEKKINEIHLKKQDRFNEGIERNLLKFRCFLAMVKKQEDILKENLIKLEKYGENTEEIMQVKYNLSVYKQDNNLFNELKAICIKACLSEKVIDENEVRFLYLTNQYEKVISKFKNEKYLDNPEIKLYVAKSLMTINEEEAKKMFCEIKDISDIFKFEYILAMVIPVLEKVKFLSKFTNSEKLIFDECLKLIETIDKKCLSEVKLKFLIYYKITMLMFIDSKQALIEIDNIPEELSIDIDFYILKINILNVNDEYEIANEICNLLLKSYSDDVYKYIENIINIKLSLKEWTDIIDIFVKYREYLKYNQYCFFAYGFSLINLYGEEHARKIIEKECKIEGEMIDLLFAKINTKNRDKCEFYLSKVVESVNQDDLILLDVVNTYKKINVYDKAVKILRKNSPYDIDFFKNYIYLVLSKELKDEFSTILEIHLENYSYIYDDYINHNIYIMCIKEEFYRKAYYISEKSFNLIKDSYWTNEYLKMKLFHKEADNLKELIGLLETETNPKYLITVSEAYLKLGDFDKSKELIYKAAYNLGSIDMESAIKIGNVLLSVYNSQKIRLDDYNEVEKKVELDNVVILENKKNELLYLCLNKESIYGDNEIRFNCIHIDKKDDLLVDLLHLKINDEIKYNSETYTIVGIIDKYHYLEKICFNIRMDDNMEGIQIININLEDKEFTDLKKVLKKNSDDIQLFINAYTNKLNSIGLPINFISKDIKNIDNWIDFLLQNKNEKFITGYPVEIPHKNAVVLTTVATLFLNKYDILDDFIRYYDVYIPSELVKMIENIIIDLINDINREHRDISLVENNLFINRKDDKYKKEEINKYKKIEKSLKKANILSVDTSRSKLFLIQGDFMYSSDLAAIELARQKNIPIFIEDRFTSLISIKSYRLKISNIAGFINSILFKDFKKFWPIAEELIKGKYEYFFNHQNLIFFILHFNLNTKNSIKKFEDIVKIILDNDLDNVYSITLENTCIFLFYKKLYKHYSKKIDIIMKHINLKKEQNKH